MSVKCRRCIDYYIMERRRLETINDLKGKNEGFSHAFLKSEMCEFMREIGLEFENSSLETEAYVEGIGKVDILARVGDATIAIECGTTNLKKIRALRQRFDVVLHVPYCYTGDLYHLDKDELNHQIMVAELVEGLRKEGIPAGEKGKAFCLAEGECSLPSGRKGFPKEAIEIASHREKERQTEQPVAKGKEEQTNTVP